MTTDDETWEVRPKTHLQLPIIAVGAAKDNKMKIVKIITLNVFKGPSGVFRHCWVFIF